MNVLHGLALASFFAASLVLVDYAEAAIVSPAGYTNAFGTQPPAADWVTLSIAGTSADSYSLDADVNANITSGAVTNQTTSSTGNPPSANTNAIWNSGGFYLQTRPTGNRYTALMGKFVNSTGTNATQIALSYVLTIAGSAGVVEESGKGTRVYYSLTGLANSWTNLPSLNQTLSADGTSSYALAVALNWTNGGNLFLLWADDNASGSGIDSANQFDNFSLRVTAGPPPSFVCTLKSPTNNAAFASGTAITVTATPTNGTPPYTVNYFTNSGAGNTVFALAGGSATAPFNVTFGNLATGIYNIYALATDSAGVPGATKSMTNTFVVANPIGFTLTAPTNGAAFDSTTAITATATISGGTAPYSVQFYLDDVANGAPLALPPYQRNLGNLFVGDHTIRAAVTDANGWVSNSLVSTIHISGPLGVLLFPTNGAAFVYGESLALTAVVAGGVSPYAVTIYINDQLLGAFNSPPFVTNLGLLSEGSYTCYVHATDSSLPAQQTSSTNIITILPNPLVVTLTSPTSGQSAPAGSAFALTATVSVSSPVTVSHVEFFLDEDTAGVDTTAPFSVFIASPSAGSHTVYAFATDSLGRIRSTDVNTVTFIADPLGNDNFANRYLIFGTPAHLTGANTGATTESGEPFQSGVNRWGDTLWWKWVAPTSGVVTIDTIGSDFNTFLGVYTGPAVNALSLIAQNDNASLAGVGASSVTFNAAQGTEYEIQVAGILTGGGGGAPVHGNIQLNVAVLPSVAITSPGSGSIFPLGSNIAVTAIASSMAGAISNVSLYRGTALLGSASNAPYSFVVSNAPAGTNSFYAVATDNLGEAGTSAVVRVLVASVGLTIISPSSDTIFQNANPITVSAFPMLPGGSITNVSFFVDGQLIGQDTLAPFSVVWSSVTSGPHRVTANGMDISGSTYYAPPVSISVARTFFPSHSVWKYLDNGSDQGTNWPALNFDDGPWASGAAELGYGDGDEATRVEDNATPGYNASDTLRYITTYFRRAFVVTNITSYSSLLMSVKCDDGAVVYLNGREAARFNMNTGVVTHMTTALFAGDDGATFVPVTVPASFLVEGTNVAAVEVHQSTADSTDLSFDMDLSGLPSVALPLKIDSIAWAQPNVILTFHADANVSYTLEHATALGDWQTVQAISPAPTNRTIAVTRPGSETTRFYRLRSP